MAKADTLRYIKNAKEMGLSRLRKWEDLESTKIRAIRENEVRQLTDRIRSKMASPAATMAKVLVTNGVTKLGYSGCEPLSQEEMAEKIINSTVSSFSLGQAFYKAEEKARKELHARYDELIQELISISMKAEQAVLLTGVGDDLKAALKELDVFLAKIR